MTANNYKWNTSTARILF